MFPDYSSTGQVRPAGSAVVFKNKLHHKVQATLDPLIRENYKDRFGAAVGYLTADLTSPKLSKA